MIEISRQVDPTGIHHWLEAHLRPFLTRDRSSYAKGRLRCWLRHEPMLFAPYALAPAVPTLDETWDVLETAIGAQFDFCLITFSGDDATGILPHRDAGYANYEAWGWHINGDCRFDYWNDRQSYGNSHQTNTAPSSGPPSHVLQLRPGDVVHFNCKNQHAASPGANRWNLNFWRAKCR